MSGNSMLTRPPIGTLLLVAIVLAVLVMFAVASGTPYFGWFRLLFSLALVILAAWEWRAKGREWLPILSWAIPLTVTWSAAQYLVDRPVAVVVIIFWLGCGVLLVMLVSSRAARWWYEAVLRRPFEG